MEYPLPCNGVSVANGRNVRHSLFRFPTRAAGPFRGRQPWQACASPAACQSARLTVIVATLTMPFLYSLTELSHFSASNNSCLRSIFRKETDMFPNLLLPLHRIIINLRENEVYEKQCFQTTADGCAGVRPRLSVLWYVRYARRNPAQSSCGSPAARSTPTRCPTIPTTICTG